MTLEKTIKCGNCDYIGPGERSRSMAAMVFAWIGILITPLIPIIYFLVTNKYQCPKCKSTFLGVQNNEGVFAGQKSGLKSPAMIVVWIILGLIIASILASVVLVALGGVREKAREAQAISKSSTT